MFDLDAGPVTITLPDSGTRFMSLQVWDEDEFCPLVAYGAGRHELTRKRIGTRFAAVVVRTLVDPGNPDDVKQVHTLQDAIRVEQPATGTFEVPDWDPVSQTKVREALELLGTTLPDSHRTFGPKSEVDPVRHLIGAAIGWGGNPEKDAFYPTPMARSTSSSGAVTAGTSTASRSRSVGTSPYDCIGRAAKSSKARGTFPNRRRSTDVHADRVHGWVRLVLNPLRALQWTGFLE